MASITEERTNASYIGVSAIVILERSVPVLHVTLCPMEESEGAEGVLSDIDCGQEGQLSDYFSPLERSV